MIRLIEMSNGEERIVVCDDCMPGVNDDLGDDEPRFDILGAVDPEKLADLADCCAHCYKATKLRGYLVHELLDRIGMQNRIMYDFVGEHGSMHLMPQDVQDKFNKAMELLEDVYQGVGDVRFDLD